MKFILKGNYGIAEKFAIFIWFVLFGMIVTVSCSPHWYWKTDHPQANIRVYYDDGTYEDYPLHRIDKIKVTTYDLNHVKVEWEGLNPL